MPLLKLIHISKASRGDEIAITNVFVYITLKSVDRHEVYAPEKMVLAVINGDLSTPILLTISDWRRKWHAACLNP